MQSYASVLGVPLNEEEIRKSFKGRRFTPAECKEVVLRLKLRPNLKVEDILDELRVFSQEDGEDDADDDDEGAPASSASEETGKRKRGRPRKSE